MTRAFSFPSSTLRYLLGYSLVHADHVAICSPWLSDVEIRLPLGTEVDGSRRVSLSRAVAALDTTVDIYVREGEEHINNFAVSRLDRTATVTHVEELHAKTIVTDEYVYVGSANITRNGILTNRELCELVENDYENVATYMRTELDLTPDSS